MTIIAKLKRAIAPPLAITIKNEGTRKIMVGVGVAAIMFLLLSAYLDLRSAQSLRKVVRVQFNEEQMVVARHIRWLVERELSFVRKEIEMLAGMIRHSQGHIKAIQEELGLVLRPVLGDRVYRTEIIDLGERTIYSFGYPRHWRVQALPENTYDHMIDTLKDSHIFVSTPTYEKAGMHLLMGCWIAESNMLLIEDLDVTRLLKEFLGGIRSGKTGYAWVIDGNGTFLYHPYAEFIGKCAFTARDEREPEIPHHAINFIQENEMLKGHEGTGSYTAGWHRGFIGETKKLIAYCPISVSPESQQKWSVAVVAPVSEIEGYITQTYLWRFLFQALIILVIMFFGGAMLFNEVRWAHELSRKVEERTEALKRSEEKYRSLVESAEDFIFTIDRKGRLQSMNSFTAHFFGGRPDDFVGLDIDNVLPLESSQTHHKLLELVFNEKRSVRDEFTLKLGDQELQISANFMPIRDNSRRVESVLCIARDITSERQLERQLINTEKLAALGTLAAGVAHEINNPLSIILGFADLLVRKTPKDMQAYEDLRTIERQGMYCKQIVENLLRFARFGEQAEGRSDVNEAICEILNIVSHTLQMEAIELVTHLDRDIPFVHGDPRELQQVFLNLINNACSAMKGGGKLTIRSKYDRKKRKAIIQIEDTGHGISKENIDRIFEPFFTTKPEGEGTGLGLSVSYGIISKYGGVIECQSTSVGPKESAKKDHGTIFTLKMPIFEMES